MLKQCRGGCRAMRRIQELSRRHARRDDAEQSEKIQKLLYYEINKISLVVNETIFIYYSVENYVKYVNTLQ